MSKETYKTEDMTAYLLGNLPEVEAEKFDELSFTDEDFAVNLSATENDLIDSYIKGELVDESLARFENYYLATPQRREKVEFAKSFQNFTDEEFQHLPLLSAENSEKSPAGFFSKMFFVPKFSWQWGLALTGLAFLISGVWLWSENSRLHNELSKTQTNRNEVLQKRENELVEREKQMREEIKNQQIKNSEIEKELAETQSARTDLETNSNAKTTTEKPKIVPPTKPQIEIADNQKPPKKNVKPIPTPTKTQPSVIIASFILTPSLRGNNQLATVQIPLRTTSAEFRLSLESNDFSSYRVTMLNPADGSIIRSLGNFKPKTNAGNDFLNIRLPASSLKPQIYTFEVSGISADGTTENIGSYSFQVVP